MGDISMHSHAKRGNEIKIQILEEKIKKAKTIIESASDKKQAILKEYLQ